MGVKKTDESSQPATEGTLGSSTKEGRRLLVHKRRDHERKRHQRDVGQEDLPTKGNRFYSRGIPFKKNKKMLSAPGEGGSNGTRGAAGERVNVLMPCRHLERGLCRLSPLSRLVSLGRS